MPSARWSFAGRMTVLGAAILFAAGFANSQVTIATNSEPSASMPAGESSSTDAMLVTSGDVAEPSAPAPSSSAAAGQYDNKSHGGASGWKGKLAFDFGGGLNIPTSETSPYINTGYQIQVGGGFHLSRGLSLLAEYQFINDGLPSNIARQAGVDGGNVHLWSFTLNPIIDLMPHHNSGVYVTGGGGFYRKVTNFQVQTPQQYCTYFYCGVGYAPQTVGHFSSNQGGWNVGAGFSHRFAGMYNDGKMAFFAEAKYLDVKSPAIDNQSPNGLGNTTIGEGTKLIPITFGLRW